MHVNLGAPYESIMETAIKMGYASSQTEVMRQALVRYKDYLMTENEEKLVIKAMDNDIAEIKKNKEKWYTLDEVKKDLGLENVNI
ncbi:MAG: hypothetical protein COT14_02620 [Candidatus Diapherotrites archaeon CG08_land_8_20_14_0_20_30_16]|nr:MAG: hypothetical protein COT14_02620 [Candidatus Diapherotrites archaeon CG08_land_8_20_14_0_20_30_16]